MIKVAMDSGALAAKLAGAGGGGTIIVLTHEKERVMKALKDVGAEEFVTLDPKAGGVKVECVDDESERIDIALYNGVRHQIQQIK